MTAADVHEETELDRIERWRREELVRAGYPGDAADALARRHDVDLHVAADLLRRGCPPQTALKILL